MRALLLVPLLAATSCYNPKLISGRYKCDQPGDVCPGTFVCAAGRCVDPNDATADMPLAAPDAVPPGEDLSTPADMPETPKTDMAGSDMTADMTSTPTCTKVGMAATLDVLACKAIFTAGNTGGICPMNYRVCTKDDGNMLYESVTSGSACQDLGGFYATQISASIQANGNVNCDATTIDKGWALLGCGSEVLAGDMTKTGTKTAGNDCHKLKGLLPCASGVKGWSCITGLIDTTQAGIGRGGLLCCKIP